MTLSEFLSYREAVLLKQRVEMYALRDQNMSNKEMYAACVVEITKINAELAVLMKL